jgi:hypothetical protein
LALIITSAFFLSLQQKPFDEGAVDFEEKILKHEIVANSSLDVETTSFHHWEDSSNCSQEDGNNSTSNCSQEDGNNSTSNCSQEDGNNSSKERLVIKFRRITGTYYMVDDIVPDSPDSSFKYFNYKSERYSFPEYLTVAPSPPAKKGTGSPKVVRCKTCRKVFSKMSTLKVHRKTHAAFAPAGTFTPGDFAKRFSSEKLSRVGRFFAYYTGSLQIL